MGAGPIRLASGYRCSLASPPGRLAIAKEMMAVAPLAEAIQKAPAVQGWGWDRGGLRPEPARQSRACGRQGMTSSRERAALLRPTPSTARIDLVIRCRSGCLRDDLREDAGVAGGVAHRDDFWHRQEARRMAGSVWLTHRDMNATSS